MAPGTAAAIRTIKLGMRWIRATAHNFIMLGVVVIPVRSWQRTPAVLHQAGSQGWDPIFLGSSKTAFLSTFSRDCHVLVRGTPHYVVRAADWTGTVPDPLQQHSSASPYTRRRLVAAARRISTEPPHERWRAQMEGIRCMRKSKDAAVDFAGAGALKDSSVGSDDDVRFQVLMSAMLSSQTKDPVTAAAVNRMREVCAPSSLGAATLAASIDEESLGELLLPVSFAKTKAKHILMVCEQLSKANGDRPAGGIPDSVEGLLDLPGVGPKMTYLVMDHAWGRNEGICVDTHVHRISNRLGWVDTWNRKNPKSQNPEKTRKHLQAWLPREHWSETNELLVGFGQQVCRAIGPSCSNCGISDICPSFENRGNLSFESSISTPSPPATV